MISLGPIDRLLLLGGGEILVQLAEWAVENLLRTSVITAPRHVMEIVPSSGKSLGDHLFARGIEVNVVTDFDRPETALLIGDMGGTFALSTGAAWIFRKEMIERWFNNRLFNLHGTRLPQNRGGASCSWQILMGNRFGFCQLHVVDGRLDTGPIVAFEEFLYPAYCRVPKEYMAFADARSFQFVTAFLSPIRDCSCDFTLIAQPEYLSTYWPRLHTPTQAWIDWRWMAPFIDRFVCAFDDPYSGAQTTWNGRVVRLKRAFASGEDGSFHPFQAGIVYRNNGRWICIACNGGSLVVEDVRDEQGQSLLNDIRVGDAFATPPDKLLALANRVQFDALGLRGQS